MPTKDKMYLFPKPLTIKQYRAKLKRQIKLVEKSITNLLSLEFSDCDFYEFQIRPTCFSKNNEIVIKNVTNKFGCTCKIILEWPRINMNNIDTVDDLDLSTRAENALMFNGIVTISELCKKSKDDLLRIKNFGVACLKEVESALKKYNKGLNDKPAC